MPSGPVRKTLWLACNKPPACRALDLLLAVAYASQEGLQHILQAGVMAVVVNAVAIYTQSLKQVAALQHNADSDTDDEPSSSGLHRSAITPTAVLTALSLCEVSWKSSIREVLIMTRHVLAKLDSSSSE